ncbi:MAG: hypothetical protein KDD50_05665 [Bdellovibrionales bacterium]|nr:hypothetical protein [Bdellovibrionales bacterium]
MKFSVPSIIVATGDTNSQSLARYDLEGKFVDVIASYRNENATPRGIAYADAESVIVAFDTTDFIDRVYFNGTKESFYGANQFNGNIYDMELADNGYYYAIESNNIEVFSSAGELQTSMRIPTTVGSCVLSSPRGLAIDANGYLVVTNQGGTDTILRYNISDPLNPSCVSSVAFGNNPYGVLAHSDGYLYVVTQGDDQIYRANADGSGATVIWSVDLTILRDPTAIKELPDGTLIVASSFHDTVERFDTNGNRIGTTPFIRDQSSTNITDMIILGGQ